MSKSKTLVAIDYGHGQIESLTAVMGEALESATVGTERGLTVHRLTFDATELRYAYAHQYGCNRGFVCHIEDGASS